jgi:hypothetical protein
MLTFSLSAACKKTSAPRGIDAPGCFVLCSMLRAQLDDACAFVSHDTASLPDERQLSRDGADSLIGAQFNSLLSGLGYFEQQLDTLLTRQEDVFDALVASVGPIATSVAATDAAELDAAMERLTSDPLSVVEAIEAYVQSLGSGVERRTLSGWRSLIGCSAAMLREHGASLPCLPTIVEETNRLLNAVAHDAAINGELREAAFPSRSFAELLVEVNPVPVWTDQEKRHFASNILEVRRLVAHSESATSVLRPEDLSPEDPPLTVLLKRCERLFQKSELLAHTCVARVAASECDRVCGAVLDSMLIQALDRVAAEVETKRMRELQLCCVAQSRMHEAARMWLDSNARSELEDLRALLVVADAQSQSDSIMEAVEAELGQFRRALAGAAGERATCLASMHSTTSGYRAFVMRLFQGSESLSQSLSSVLASVMESATDTQSQSLADVMQRVMASHAATELEARRKLVSDPDDPSLVASVVPGKCRASGLEQPEFVLDEKQLLALHEALHGILEEAAVDGKETSGDRVSIPLGLQTAVSDIEAVSRLFQWSDDMCAVTLQSRDMYDVYDIVRSATSFWKIAKPSEPSGDPGPLGDVKNVHGKGDLGRLYRILEAHEAECKSLLQGWAEAFASEMEFGAMSCAVALQLIQLVVSTSARRQAQLDLFRCPSCGESIRPG